MSHPAPAVTLSNYVSYLVSPYHTWFEEMGYPELDILTFEDGEWALIQYLTSPTVPSMTKWEYVLTGIRHTERSYYWCRKYANNLDMEKQYLWDQMDEKDKETAREEKARADHDEDIANRRFEAIRRNRGLVERISKNGLAEMTLSKISKHIPNYRFR